MWFTWWYLRSYNALNPELRSSNSTLAVGAAALVASDAVRRTNWDSFPVELQDAAAILNSLLLYRPELLDACFSKGAARRRQLIDEAIRSMCAVEGKGSELAPVHRDPAWLETAPLDSAAGDGPMSLGEFLPPESKAVERLADLACGDSGIQNLTIRATIVSESCLPRFGVPSHDANPAVVSERWAKELDRLILAVKDEMRIRCTSALAPMPKGNAIVPIVADPSVLRPLMVIAGQASSARLSEAARKNIDTFRKVLRPDPVIGQVLRLAGPDDPVVETFGTAGRAARLTWQQLMRVNPAGDADKVHFESVSVNLAIEEPSGAGRSITGVGAGSHVLVQGKGAEPEHVPIEQVKEGMNVRGYLDIKPPTTSPGRFSIVPAPRAEWFRVSHVNTRPVPVWMKVGFEETGQEIVLGIGHKLVLGHDSEEASWREPVDLDHGSAPWLGGQAPRVAWTQRISSPDVQRQRILYELSLTWDHQRGRAHNIEVLTPDRKARLLVEARSVNAGPIGSKQTLATADGQGVAIGEVTCETANSKQARGARWLLPQAGGRSLDLRTLDATPDRRPPA